MSYSEFEDEDGIDGPFDEALERAMEEDRKRFARARASLELLTTPARDKARDFGLEGGIGGQELVERLKAKRAEGTTAELDYEPMLAKLREAGLLKLAPPLAVELFVHYTVVLSRVTRLCDRKCVDGPFTSREAAEAHATALAKREGTYQITIEDHR